MKKIITASIAASLLFSTTSTYASPITIKTPSQQTINGSDVQIREGRMLIPIRDLAESIGATLATDPVHHKVALKKWGERYVFTIGKARYRVNKDQDPTPYLVTPIQQINGQTYIPVNFLMLLGYGIDYQDSQLSIKSPLSEKSKNILYHGDLNAARQMAIQITEQLPQHGKRKLLETHQTSEVRDNQYLFPSGEALRFYTIYGNTVSFIEFKDDFPVITWQAHIPKDNDNSLNDFLSFKLVDQWGTMPLKYKEYFYYISSYFGDSNTLETGIIHPDGSYNRSAYEQTVGGSLTSKEGKISFVMPEEKRTD